MQMAPDHPCSTKMLIRRFESMSSSDLNPSRSQCQASPVRSSVSALVSHSPSKRTFVGRATANEASTGTSETDDVNGKGKEKDKSPIRQSIRNLLSVFTGKRHVPGGSPRSSSLAPEPERGQVSSTRGPLARTKAEKTLPAVPVPDIDVPSVADSRYEDVQMTKPPVARGIPGKLPRVTLFDAPVPPIPSDEDLLGSPSRNHRAAAKIHGVVLYLSYYKNGLGSFPSPVWLPCTATLEVEDQAIVVSWASPDVDEGQVTPPRLHMVTLARCTDIRSLVTSQLDEHDMKVPLVGCKDGLRIGDFKVFEVLFEGRGREKFAAKTVRERARWVSAIWDAVLPSQVPKASPDIEPRAAEAAVSNTVCSSGSSNPPYVRRSLPVTPPRVIPAGANDSCQDRPLESSPPSSFVTTSIYPPTRPLSRFSDSNSVKSTSSERCHSPSITNLNQRSMVKQRIAQIKNMELQRKTSGSSTSSKPLSRRGSMAEHGNDRNGQMNASLVAEIPPVRIEKHSLNEEITFLPTTEVVVAGGSTSDDTSQGEKLQTSVKECAAESREARSLRNLNLEPLLYFMKEHAQEQGEKVMHLGDQLVCLQDEIQRLPQEFSCMVGGLHTENSSTSVKQLVTKVERKVEAATDVLGAMEDKLTTLSDGLKQQAQIETAGGKTAAEALRAMDGIRTQLRSDFPSVMAKLAQIQEAQERSEKVKERTPLADRNKQLPAVVDLSTVLAKLDAVIALQRKAAGNVGKAAGKAASAKAADVSSKDMKGELLKVSSLLNKNDRQLALHTQQQADSVRYLTELNTWLEAFVNHGTSQIKGVAANVEQLCRALGSSDQLGSSMDVVGRGSLLHDLRTLVANAQAREQSSAELQASINALLAAMKASSGPGSSAVVDAIERQRREQADIFKAMTKELAGEIKGERIRFVEAMKEATTINIQAQLDSLNRTVAAEVVKVSNEMARLRQEKHVIECQIQDLLAFQDQQRLSGRKVQVGISRYQPHAEEYPTLLGSGQMSFPGR